MTNPFEHVPRKTFTPQERARIFVARGGRCHRCTRKIQRGEDWTLEHLIALENGGTNDEENMTVTCDWCEPEKTAEDHSKAGHSRRVFTRHVVPGRFMKSRAWGRR